MGNIFGVPDPAGSPLEKLEVPRKAWAGSPASSWDSVLRGEGVPEELVTALAKAFQRHSEQKLLDAEANYRALEDWANIHTHSAGGEEPLPPLDHDFTHIATSASATVGRVRATTGDRVWAESGAGHTIRTVAVDPDSGDYFAVKTPSSGPTELIQYDKDTGAFVKVGDLPSAWLNGDGEFVIVPGGRGYYMPGRTSGTSVWAISLSDASTIWESPLLSGWGNALVVSPDGLYVYAAENSSTSTERHVTEINAATGASTRVIDLLGASPVRRMLSISPGGTRLYVGVLSPHEVRQYGVGGGAGWTLDGAVNGLDVHPGTGNVYSIREDPKDGTTDNLYANDPDTGDELDAHINPPGGSGMYRLVMSPDGLQVYYASNVSGSHTTRAVDVDNLADILWVSPTSHGVEDATYSEG